MDIVKEIGVPTTLKISITGNKPFSRKVRSKVKRSRSTAKKTAKIAKKRVKIGYIFKNFINFFRMAGFYLKKSN